MSPRGNPRHSVHGFRGRLKLWLIAFNFDRFRVALGPVIFLSENLPMDTSRFIMHLGCFAPSELPPQCHQITYLWFCGAAKEWPRNSRKSCSYARSKSWKSLNKPSHFPSRHPTAFGARVSGMFKIVTIAVNFDRFRDPPGPTICFSENLHMGCGTIYNTSWVFRTIWITPIMSPNHPFMILWCSHGMAPKRL